MTNREYIIKTLDGLNITDNDVDLIIIKAGINADGVITESADTRKCDMAIYNRMSVVIKPMMQNVTEGGYSVSWNMDAVKIFYAALCNELGVENVMLSRPKIRNRSNYW